MSHTNSDLSDTWDIPILDSVREMFYNMMGACATILKQQKVIAGLEQLCWAAQLQAVALPPQPFLFHDPALQVQPGSGGAGEPAVSDRWNLGMAVGRCAMGPSCTSLAHTLYM